VSYTWFGPSVGSGSNTANPTVDQMGTYTVVLTDTVTGCSSTSTVDVTQGNVVAAFSADQTTGFAPLAVNFTDASIGATSYNWSFGNGSTSSIQNPNTVYANSGTYTVMLIASSGPCSDTAYSIINVYDNLFIPEIFSPNGDGKNDFFVIKGLQQYPNNKITIYNRWGNKVYEKEKYSNDWDGKPNVTIGTGSNVLASGTYYVVFDKGDGDKPYAGYVHIEY
jgi:gliding motility-associated-like protein